MSQQKATVEAYFEGFRRSDHAMVLACLTDDVVWDIHGFARLTGKAAFDREIENEQFVGRPTLVIDRLVEEGEVVVASGRGESMRKTGEPFRFRYCDLFAFRGEQICRVESYLVPLSQEAAPLASP